MWDRLEEVVQRYEEVGRMLSQPEIIKDRTKFSKYSREHKDLTEVVATFKAYKKVTDEIKGSKAIIHEGGDSELVEMAQLELKELEAESEALEQELKILLLPKDPLDDKNVIVELRAGTGGDEASLFASELGRMYLRYAELRGWKAEFLGASYSDSGGYKEAAIMLSGDKVYSRLKYEAGVHRVQRVPATESQGRIHTSTVTVAVLPEAEDVEVEVLDSDLRIDVYRASGPGGQSVNTTDSAVRITHLPTGIVVAMQDEKSQIKNKEKALKVLKARILAKKEEELAKERRDERRSQVGTGERSEKIRTYNFPQSRITDHRIQLTLHSLEQVLNGALDEVIDPLVANYQAAALQQGDFA
jgi:peptide chain release factor 1